LGRTVPSFRNVLAMEKREWKPFRNALDKKERKEFDEIWKFLNSTSLLALIQFTW